MNPIVEKNISIFRAQGADRFTSWLIDRYLQKSKSDVPFIFPPVYDFEDILEAIYSSVDETEKTSIRWSVSQMAKAWNIRHGMPVLRKIIRLGTIVNSQGAFLNTIHAIRDWRPGKEEYLNIIELGKIADELWSAKLKFNDPVIEDTPFVAVARHFKQLLQSDSKSHFKLIHSPLFKIACYAELGDWPVLASQISKCYSYNEVDDPWPKECALFENSAGQKGFYDLWPTLKEILSKLNRDDLLKGCELLSNGLYQQGGRECLDELYSHDWVRILGSCELLIGRTALEATAMRMSAIGKKYYGKSSRRSQIHTPRRENISQLRKLVASIK